MRGGLLTPSRPRVSTPRGRPVSRAAEGTELSVAERPAQVGGPTYDPFFTVATLARYLVVSERTIRQMVTDRRIASYRIEGQRRFAVSDVEAYLRHHRSAAER